MTTALNTSAIGSLPHHNIDTAIEFSFQLGIPFLPQIPIRNPWEYMIPQALDGLPGLHIENDGIASLNLDVWQGRSWAFNEKLLNAFAGAARPDAFEAFEPSSSNSSCWQPFLWELGERKTTLAKIQIAGPLTAQWSLRLEEDPSERRGEKIERLPELSMQIFRLVLARAIAMCRRLQASGIRPLIFLDEPGLFSLNLSHPKHCLALQELKLLVQALRKEGALVGLHCCGDTQWGTILQLGLDVISLDTGLSLQNLLKHLSLIEAYLDTGGRLSLGVIPTSGDVNGRSALDHYAHLMAGLTSGLHERMDLMKRILHSALFTPACGLALQSTSDAEKILSLLIEVGQIAQAAGTA